MKTVRTTSLFNKVQSGFALLPVAVALAVVASIVLLINFQGANSVNRAASDVEANQAHYIAQAGLQHALWQVRNSKCTGDFSIPATTLGSDSYSASSSGGGTTTAYTLTVDQDAWIRNDNPTTNNGSNADLHIRFESGNIEQPLVRFDLSPLPANAQINSASLWFYIESGKEHPEGHITLHRITEDWIESDVTWDSFNGSYDAATLGMISAQVNSDAWVQVNITAQVQAWVNGEPNFGVLLNSIAEGIHGEYISSEGASGKQPRLEVVVGNGSASPIDIQVTGTLANGNTRTLDRATMPAYQPHSTTILQLGTDSGEDAMLDWFYSARNYGGANYMQIHDNGSDWKQYPIIRFDLSKLPQSASVQSARLELHMKSLNAPGTATVHQVTRNWVEGTQSGGGQPDGATWFTHDGTNNWASAGGDYNATAVTETAINNGDTWVTWEITSVVKSWFDGQPNYGVLIKPDSSLKQARFYSKEETNTAFHPKLTIEYACECGKACVSPQGFGDLLLVVADDDPIAMAPSDAKLRDIFESWGYSVTLLQDNVSQTAYNSAVAVNDVVYISETASSASVGTNLTNAPIGVVNEQGNLNDELGMALAKANPIGSSVNIVDNSHYITYPFQSGSLEIYSEDMEGLTVSGTEAPDLQTLANWSTAGGLVVLDTGMQTASGGTAAGRRVMLPLGRSTNTNFNWDYLNNNGRLLVQRSLAWGMNADAMAEAAGNLLLVVANATTPSTRSAGRKTLMESWGYTVTLIDDGDSQANFNTAMAANDVVYVTDTVSGPTLVDKVTNTTTPVVNEKGSKLGNFGFSSSESGTVSATGFVTTDAAHYITEPFSGNPVTVFTSSLTMGVPSGTLAPDLQNVGDVSGTPALATLDTGATLWNGGSAPARRAHVPLGAAEVAEITDDGQTIMQRAIEWAAGSAVGTAPIAHWKLDETSGTNAEDSIGSNDATLNGDSTWTVGTIDGALEFDGSNDFAITNSNFTPPPVGTVTFWMQVSGSPTSQGRILGLDDTWEIRHVTTGTPDGIPYGLVFDLGVTGVNTEFVTTTTIDAPGQWYHIAASYDTTNDEYAVYIDGALHKSGTYSSSLAVPAAALLSIGTRTGSTNYFDGVLDDVRIYDRFLSASDVADLAAAGAGTYTVLMVVSDPGKLLTPAAADRKVLMESWGYTVNVIDNDDTAANFVAAIDVADVVYIGSGTSPTDVLTKVVVNSAKGVVNEPVGLASTMGFASSWTPVSFDQLTIVDSSHSITQGLVSPFTVFTSSLVATELSGSLSPDLQNLAAAAFAAPAIAVLGSGATRHDVGITAGRRAQLPFASAIGSDLTADGQLIVRRAIEWAAGSGGGGGGPTSTCAADDFETDDYSGNTGDFNWNDNWVEVNESTNPNNGDEQVVILDGGNHVARVRDNDSGGEGILRSVDLSTFTSATLNFNYWRSGLDNSNDYASVQVWPNASDEWEEVLRIEGPGTDDAGSPQSASHDISAFIMNDTHIRFITSPNMGSSDSVYFDNIEVCGQ